MTRPADTAADTGLRRCGCCGRQRPAESPFRCCSPPGSFRQRLDHRRPVYARYRYRPRHPARWSLVVGEPSLPLRRLRRHKRLPMLGRITSNAGHRQPGTVHR